MLARVLLGVALAVLAVPSAAAVSAWAAVQPERLNLGTGSSMSFAVHFEADTKCASTAEEPLTFRLADPLVHVVRFEQTTAAIEWEQNPRREGWWEAEGTFWLEVRRATASGFSERTHWTTAVGPGSDACTDPREPRSLESRSFDVTAEPTWGAGPLAWAPDASPAVVSVGVLGAAAGASAAVGVFVVVRARRSVME